MNPTKKVVLALSGGLDSTALMDQYLRDKCCVLPVFFRYGSKHSFHEATAAYEVLEAYQKQFAGGFVSDMVVLDVRPTFQNHQCSLMKHVPRHVPQGHYQAESMKDTVVSGRNLLFAAHLAAVAGGAGFNTIALGVHAGDHYIYPDCRPAFAAAAAEAVYLGSGGEVKLEVPFVHMTKADILRTRPDAPYHLTRTCYTNQDVACGKCGSCVERRMAFVAVGRIDPIEYQE